MYFAEQHIIVGVDKFYKLDVHDWSMEEFLDKCDSSLAFAVFGAAHYDSFPIAVLRMSEEGEPLEYLLCYNGK